MTLADIINLRQARKVRQRANSERIAAENRARFGRTKSEKERDRMESERQIRQIDGAKRDSDG